jgi:hypothetical protein
MSRGVKNLELGKHNTNYGNICQYVNIIGLTYLGLHPLITTPPAMAASALPPWCSVPYPQGVARFEQVMSHGQPHAAMSMNPMVCVMKASVKRKKSNTKFLSMGVFLMAPY